MSWKPVCKAADIADDEIKLFQVDGIDIVVVNIGDRFVAIPPHCPHMEEPLVDSGLCRDGTLTCTKHLWQWNMRTGEAQGIAEKPLLLYEMKRQGDDVLVFIEEELTYEWEDAYDDDDDDDEDDED